MSGERVPPLNLTEGERDVLLDIVTVSDDMDYPGEDFQSLLEKVRGLYRPAGEASR